MMDQINQIKDQSWGIKSLGRLFANKTTWTIAWHPNILKNHEQIYAGKR